MREISSVSARSRVVDLRGFARSGEDEPSKREWTSRNRKPAAQLEAKRDVLQKLKDRVEQLANSRREPDS